MRFFERGGGLTAEKRGERKVAEMMSNFWRLGLGDKGGVGRPETQFGLLHINQGLGSNTASTYYRRDLTDQARSNIRAFGEWPPSDRQCMSNRLLASQRRSFRAGRGQHAACTRTTNILVRPDGNRFEGSESIHLPATG